MQNNLVETLIGALVVVIAAVFLIYGYKTAGMRDTGGYKVTAQFDRVDGLTNGSDVRLSGIKIGTVVSQQLDPESYRAVITLRLQSDVAVPEDTNARITSSGLLGNSYISLTPGGSTDMLKEGDEIQFTQGAIDLISLLGQAIFSPKSSGEKGADTGAAPQPQK